MWTRQIISVQHQYQAMQMLLQYKPLPWIVVANFWLDHVSSYFDNSFFLYKLQYFNVTFSKFSLEATKLLPLRAKMKARQLLQNSRHAIKYTPKITDIQFLTYHPIIVAIFSHVISCWTIIKAPLYVV